MKSWGLFVKRVLVAASCVLLSTFVNAATIEATNMADADGVNFSFENYFNVSLTANNISDATTDPATNTSIFETFTLTSVFNSTTSLYEGSLSIGSLLTADFSNLVVNENPAGGNDFFANLSYTGGSLMGSLSDGTLSGGYTTDLFTGNVLVLATVTEVQAVPVPAAVWLFGSGLIGLVGIARRKKAA